MSGHQVDLPGGARFAMPRRRIKWGLSPVRLLILSLASLLLIGTGLLLLPAAHRPEVSVTPLDALFTATSAATLTGLTAVSTADTWSIFGQLVILGVVQIAALCYMTCGIAVALMLGMRVGLRTRLKLREAHGAFNLPDLLRVFRFVAIGTLGIELVGAILLFGFFHAQAGHSVPGAIYASVFYAVSAFCNAGFTLAPGFQGLTAPALHANLPVLVIIGGLVLLGGLGLPVLRELGMLPNVRRMSLHAKLVLTATLVLTVAGTLLFLLFESHNPVALAGLETPLQRGVVATFMAITPRTAGFSPLDLALLTPPTRLLLAMLMLVGASPDGTGGGVKTTTVAVMALAIWTLLRRRSDIEAFGRRISGEMVRIAMSLVSIALGTMLVTMLGIIVSEITVPGLPPTAETAARFNDLIFTVIAAYGNVALDAGTTHTLNGASRLLLTAAMFIGRVGPLVFVFTFAQPTAPRLQRLPSEPIMAG